MCRLCDTEGRYEWSQHRAAVVLSRIDVEALLTKAARMAFKGQQIAAADIRQLTQASYAQYRDAIAEGAGELAHQAQLGTPNFEMLKNLQTNAGTFAAFKTRSHMRELTKALIDPETKQQRSFAQFMQATAALQQDYNVNWARTEYDTAVRSSRMATVWGNIQASKDIYPNIRYLRTRSANEDPEHLRWVGTVLPIDHPFWRTHFPPNRWGCKCSAEPTDEFPTEVPAGMPDEGFAFNAGADGKVFDVDSHPYSQLPKKDRVRAAQEASHALVTLELQESMQRARKAGLMGKLVDVPAIGKQARIVGNMWRKQGARSRYLFEKLWLLDNITTILAEATLVGYENKKADEKPDVLRFIVLAWRLGEKQVTVKLREMKTGEITPYYLHVAK